MIKLRQLLAEAITIQGVELKPASPTMGGPLLAKYQGVVAKYRVTVNTLLYDGPVGITRIWEKAPGSYQILDNTGKKFNFDRTDIAAIIRNIKQQAATIAISKPGADITLTRSI